MELISIAIHHDMILSPLKQRQQFQRVRFSPVASPSATRAAASYHSASLLACFRPVHTKSAAAQAPTVLKEAQAESPALSELQLYNTMGRRKQVFRPRQNQGQNISMYVCGVTVYDW